MSKPTRLELLEYALEGVRTLLGSHPDPNRYPDDINELEAHLEHIEKLIERERAKEKK